MEPAISLLFSAVSLFRKNNSEIILNIFDKSPKPLMQTTKKSEQILTQVAKGSMAASAKKNAFLQAKRPQSKSPHLQVQTSNLSTHYSKSMSTTHRSSSSARKLKFVPPLQPKGINMEYYEGSNIPDKNNFLSQTSREEPNIRSRRTTIDRAHNDTHNNSQALSPGLPQTIPLLSLQKFSPRPTENDLGAHKRVLEAKNARLGSKTDRTQNFYTTNSFSKRSIDPEDRNTRSGFLERESANTTMMYRTDGLAKNMHTNDIDLSNFLKFGLSTVKGIVRTKSNYRVRTENSKRMLQSLRVQINDIKKELQNDQSNGFLKINPEVIKRENFEKQADKITKLQDGFSDIFYVLREALDVTGSKQRLQKVMQRLGDAAKDSDNYKVHLYCLKIAGKLAYERRDIAKAEYYFRQCKLVSDINRSQIDKCRAYKNLGRCSQERYNYKRALNYFIKMLQLAWYCNNKEYELNAYDHIGLQYYYLGQIEKANYYHFRSMNGAVETENSSLRLLGISRVTESISKYTGNRLRKRVSSTKETMPAFHDNSSVSSDDDVDLPLPTDYEEVMSKLDQRKKASQSRMNLTKTKMTNFAEMNKKTISIHKIFFSKEEFNEQLLMKDPISILKSMGKNSHSQKLTERIVTSHLSPNRGLNNFANINLNNNNNDLDDQADMRTTYRLKIMLEKLIVNLEIVYSFVSQIGIDLDSGNFVYRIEQDDSVVKLRKKFFEY